MTTKPSLALIPSAYKASKVYSVLPNDGTGDFDFSRATTATRINKDGLIETVGSNIPRLNYPMIDGVVSGCPSLLLEPQRSNLVTYSEAISNWVQDGATTLDNNIISPDGTLNASKITFNSGNERVYTFANTTNGSFSAYFKGVQGKKVKLRDNSGTIITEITLTENWVRHYLYKGTLNTNIQIQNIDANEVYVWGVQVEEGIYATSYIPTNGGTVTRVAETCNGAGDASTFNDSEGVLFAEISALANDGTDRVLGISDGSANNRIILYYNSSNNLVAQVYSISNNLQSTITVTDLDITNFSKASIKYDTNSIKLYLNGFLRESKSIATAPINLSELAFDNGISASDFYGKTKQIQYFDSALNNTELETLTSWRSFTEMATGQLYSVE